MRVQPKVARACPEVIPRRGPTDERGGSVEDEKKPDADANEEQARFTIFRKKGQTHRANLSVMLSEVETSLDASFFSERFLGFARNDSVDR